MTATNARDAIINAALDDLLLRGSADWVMMVEVSSAIKAAAARNALQMTPDERISTGVEVVRRLLEGGLMTAGDVGDEPPGFAPWALHPAEAADRIEREWRRLGADLEMGDVAWLANTPTGDARAAQLR